MRNLQIKLNVFLFGKYTYTAEIEGIKTKIKWVKQPNGYIVFTEKGTFRIVNLIIEYEAYKLSTNGMKIITSGTFSRCVNKIEYYVLNTLRFVQSKKK